MSLPKATSFTCFPRLPTEIRLAIWRYAVPERILTIKSIPSVPNPLFTMGETFYIIQPQRSLSQVNRESRGETNDQYIQLKPTENLGLRNDVFFNHRKDTILFPARSFNQSSWRRFVRIFSDREDLKIERLALDIGMVYFNISPPLFTKRSFLPWVPLRRVFSTM